MPQLNEFKRIFSLSFRTSRWSKKSAEARGAPPGSWLPVSQNHCGAGGAGSVRPLHHGVPPATGQPSPLTTAQQSDTSLQLWSADAQILNKC